MDRFIGYFEIGELSSIWKFKIQYGQIYSSLNDLLNPSLKKFKIQYGQIYRF